ncbi:hypothetical protein NDU88_007016 [Pleurodeles waltl]|uniref:Uncharacterized protein n=1 Tax=Pleurodeles waltl TaxID=8319 RepID=A0AAV7VNH8_PLEWA|nr:hypothetical protein NDU88_007016 [Pleurodeles waltl]
MRVCPPAAHTPPGRLAGARSGRGTAHAAHLSKYSPRYRGPRSRATPPLSAEKSSGGSPGDPGKLPSAHHPAHAASRQVLRPRASAEPPSQRPRYLAPGAAFMSLKTSALLPAGKGSLCPYRSKAKDAAGHRIFQTLVGRERSSLFKHPLRQPSWPRPSITSS